MYRADPTASLVGVASTPDEPGFDPKRAQIEILLPFPALNSPEIEPPLCSMTCRLLGKLRRAGRYSDGPENWGKS